MLGITVNDFSYTTNNQAGKEKDWHYIALEKQIVREGKPTTLIITGKLKKSWPKNSAFFPAECLVRNVGKNKKAKVQKLQQKVANQCLDWLHKVSYRLVQEYDRYYI